jgi:hypothetical protein
MARFVQYRSRPLARGSIGCEHGYQHFLPILVEGGGGADHADSSRSTSICAWASDLHTAWVTVEPVAGAVTTEKK